MKLQLKDFSYRYRSGQLQWILERISLEVASGDYYAVCGPNGAGKSTLLKALAGVLPLGKGLGEVSGSIAWDGIENIRNKKFNQEASVAYIPGTINILFPITVEEFVLQGLFSKSKFWSLPSAKERGIVEDTLKRLEIQHLRTKLVSEISAGELALTIFARALVHDPKVLLVDETTANLDLHHQLEIFQLLHDFNKEGMTVFVVSHDLNLAAEFCPKVMWLDKGRLFGAGSFEETLNDELIEKLYLSNEHAFVGKNPVTHRPKVFVK